MDAHEERQPYPSTPGELRSVFVAQARSLEGNLFSLSQQIYNEVAEVWADNPPTHTEIAHRIKKVLEDGLASITAGNLLQPARAADQAFGYPVDSGENPDPPHT